MSNRETGKLSVSEEFEKETNIVVIFGRGTSVYKEDCKSLREILGQAFPLFLEIKPYKEPKVEKWLMRKSLWHDNKLEKERNLSDLEAELKKFGISLSYLHADPDMIQYFTEEVRIWENYIGSYLEDYVESIKKFREQFEKAGLIDRVDISFRLDETTIEAGDEEVTGNYFRIRTRSLKGCEALKLCHKKIVKAFLEVLEKIDGISKVRYYCGDIEHTSHSKIACVLDKVDNGK